MTGLSSLPLRQRLASSISLRVSARNQSLMILQQTRARHRKALAGAEKVHQWRSGRATHQEKSVMGRAWLPGASGRRWPESTLSPVAWSSIAETFRDYANRLGTPDLLVKLACGRVVADPFEPRLVRQLKEEVLSTLESHRHSVLSKPGDRVDLPIDFRFLQQLLLAAEDPEVGLGDFSQGVRVGPGVRLPRLPALYAKKRRWRLPEQQPGQMEDLPTGEESPWQRNYSSVAPLEKQVVEVLEDHCARGQVRKYSEREAREKFPGLVVAALGAARKDNPDGEYTARVLFDGTNGIHVNKRIRLRDQERAPIAADIKRLMREKSRVGRKDFCPLRRRVRGPPSDPNCRVRLEVFWGVGLSRVEWST